MLIFKYNWYKLNHEKVAERFGPCTFVNSFCVNEEYEPVSVYRAHAPDRSKGHKEFILLQIISDPDAAMYGGDERLLCIRGMDKAEIEPFRFQEALHCFQCDHIIFSVNRHDMRSCKCGAVFVDGGRDYFRVGGEGYPNQCRVLTLDLLSDNYIPEPENPQTH